MSAPPIDQTTLDTAVALAQEAGRRTLQWFRSPDLEIEQKGDGTPVTAADKDAERFLREQLAVAFPGDGVLGEEEGPTESTTGRRWVIDPIDGTKAFTCGVPLYSNLLALEDEHGIAVGVVNLPGLGQEHGHRAEVVGLGDEVDHRGYPAGRHECVAIAVTPGAKDGAGALQGVQLGSVPLGEGARHDVGAGK